MIERLKQLFIISHAPLFRIPLFWLATIFPLVIALGLAVPLMQDLNFEFSTSGYKNFISTFSFPLWVASGSILFGIMVGRFHGSVQRHEAIQQTEINNSFRNYIEHKQLFKNRLTFETIRVQIEGRKKNEKSLFSNTDLNENRVYKMWFPSSTYNEFNISVNEDIVSTIKDLFEELKKESSS